MIPILECIAKRGFSLKKLKSIVQALQKPSLSGHSTIRRFGVLTSSEMLIAQRLHRFVQVPTKDARNVGQRGNVERHILNHPIQHTESIFAHSVNPDIFRNRKNPDLVSHAMDKFFDGCVRGNQRFVADFVDREFLWTVARDPKTLWSGLHFTAYNGYTELVGYFLERNANSLANSIRGETPLMLAVLGMIRHVEERISWEDGTSCVYDLEEGDGFYSHKPHSLERYDETIRILLHLDPSMYMHEDKQGRCPLQVLEAARANLAPRLKAHPGLANYVERYFWRTEIRFKWASLLHSEHSMLLDALIGTKYHSKLEVPVRQKFGWGLLFKSDRKLRAEQVYS
ncbi:Hypothetical Protein FCC1311_053032 [Hondaea fermentalgiana]|uniref:Uncharacterized protein n=1 Tax=Hondaea fermentalgiana TaxID=2315210 RepID=A0A2R5GDR8_9STRA|nr:Hypothetical Protein FCC1311_053032 [Hondaea fermentalgiana]|eukprot:GBG29080.1 Hypothetical Protein FCC1311_053032 [Hondaea fermentalgiana]